MAAWEDAPLADAAPAKQPAWMNAPMADAAPESDIPKMLPRQRAAAMAGVAPSTMDPRNLLGAVRGAASIGATLTTMPGAGYFDRRADTLKSVDDVLQGWGADPKSAVYQASKMGGEIAGTAGLGSVMAPAAKAVGASPELVSAITSAGMKTGAAPVGIKAGLADMGTRMLGGGINGAASAALVDPEHAVGGAVAGAAMPPALKAAGFVGAKAGGLLRGPAQSADAAQAIAAAREAGYVIPPTQANPTLVNRLLEGLSGKISTAQNASAANQGVTNKLAASALGLAPETKLTPDVLNGVRKQAGQAYDAISSTGLVTPGPAYSDALDKISASALKASEGFPNAKASPVIDLVESLRSKSFDAGSAVAKIKELRGAADDAFRTGNTDVGRASKAAAKALEDTLEAHLTQAGNVEALQAFRDARQLIAKTYSVEKTLNPTTGSVDARKLAAQQAKGKPLSGELKAAADFAARFPKAAQPIEGMGSLPQTSPLDWAAGGSMAAATSNPMMLAGVLARPAARKLTLSDLVQNRLVQQPGNKRLADLLNNQSMQSLPYFSAPVIAAQ